jgi:hypothetical protein
MKETRACRKYGCSSASMALIRTEGSYASRFIMRSSPAFVKNGNFCRNAGGCGAGRLSVFASGREVYSGHELAVGGPSSWKIMPSSSISVLAWKSGSFVINSAKMQPTDHRSISVEYSLAPSRISGALQSDAQIQAKGNRSSWTPTDTTRSRRAE